VEESRVLTCVYCGQAYPQDTPAWGDKVLTEHIRVCTKHPLRQAEAQIELLRSTLVDIIGASDKVELEKMALRAIEPDGLSEQVRRTGLNAIRVLLATLPDANNQVLSEMTLEEIIKVADEESEARDYREPIARHDEQQFACILRNRSGVDAGRIDFSLRDCTALSDVEQQDMCYTAFALYEAICAQVGKRAVKVPEFDRLPQVPGQDISKQIWF
jgi:hypothetical protein